MAPQLPQRRFSLGRWLRRLDRAAGTMNPFLMVLAIGLAVLNLTCVTLLALRMPVSSDTLGLSYCQPSFDCSGGLTSRR
jgi:hypothetical protein